MEFIIKFQLTTSPFNAETSLMDAKSWTDWSHIHLITKCYLHQRTRFSYRPWTLARRWAQQERWQSQL